MLGVSLDTRRDACHEKDEINVELAEKTKFDIRYLVKDQGWKGLNITLAHLIALSIQQCCAKYFIYLTQNRVGYYSAGPSQQRVGSMASDKCCLLDYC